MLISLPLCALPFVVHLFAKWLSHSTISPFRFWARLLPPSVDRIRYSVLYLWVGFIRYHDWKSRSQVGAHRHHLFTQTRSHDLLRRPCRQGVLVMCEKSLTSDEICWTLLSCDDTFVLLEVQFEIVPSYFVLIDVWSCDDTCTAVMCCTIYCLV